MNPNTILVVDDEPFLRLTLATILSRVGYSIREAGNAQEAIQALNDCHFDLIFLDLKMPGMDGLDLLPEIKASHPDIPILILTADGSLEKAIEAIRRGATDYMLKPVDPGQIILRVDDLLKEGENIQWTQEDMAGPSREDYKNKPCGPVQYRERFLNKGDFHLDFRTRQAFLRGKEIDMPPCTFEYLAALLQHAPSSVPYEVLIEEAQGYHLSQRDAQDLARWRVYRLCKAIESNPQEPHYIHNVPGIGFRIEIS